MDNLKNVLLVVFMALSGWAQGATIYVNQAATGANNGSSWADAYTDLTDALAIAATGDEIWVAAGTYLPTRDRNYLTLAAGARQDATFKLPTGVSTYGGFVGTETLLSQRDPSINICILSGDHAGNDNGVLTYTNPLLSDNSFTVVLAQGLANGDVLDGFTIQKGASRPPTTVFSIHDRLNGAGLYVNGPCDLTVNQCIFEQNTASENGGGIMVYGPNISAAVSIDISNTILSENMANKNGGGIAIHARPNTSIEVNLTDVEIIQNTARVNAGAIAQEANKNAISRAFLENVIIKDNTGAGGTIYNDAFKYGTITFEATNALIVGNSVGKVGGVMYNDARSQGNCQVLFQNCTIAENITPGNNVFCYSAAYQGGTCTSTFNNSILHQNSTSNFGAYGGATYQMDYCLVDMATCPANVSCGLNMFYSQNPGFVNQAAGDFSTNSSSFGTDQGDNAGIAGVPTDLAGNPRIQNGTVDFGAYEAGPCQAILHVNASASGSNDGTSWANAYLDLQDALAFARVTSCVQEIWVAAGTYTPHASDRTVYCDLVNDVDMYGGFPNTGNPTMADRDPVAHITRLTGEINSTSAQDNSYHIIRASFTNYTIFDGFRLEKAYYKISSNPSSSPASHGAAWWDGPGLIKNCRFYNNFSFYYAGALYCSGVEIDKCLFSGNQAPQRGGAVETLNNVRITNSRFYSNGSAGGGAMDIRGLTEIYNCIFKSNYARPPIYWSHYSGNPFQEQFAQGGAIYENNFASSGTNATKVFNSVFYGNYGVDAQGGAFATDNDHPTDHLKFYNCIFRNNSVSGNNCEDPFGGPVFNGPCVGDLGTGGVPGVTVSFYDCNVVGSLHFFVNGNFYGNTQNSNPLFNSPGTNDFRLQPTSPCINAGNSTHVPTWLTTDIGGNVRIDGSSVDMGAYENFPGSQLRTIYVNPLAVGANTGVNWANAFTNLTTALNNANANGSLVEEIWVAEGTYLPTNDGDRTKSFTLPGGVQLIGGFPNKGNPTFSDRNPEKYKTILSGDIGKPGEMEDNSYHVVGHWVYEDNIMMRAITIANGMANGSGSNGNGGGILAKGSGKGVLRLVNVEISHCHASNNGGALSLENGTVVIESCQFTSNTAGVNGSAIYMSNRGDQQSSLSLSDAIIDDNSSVGHDNVIFVENGTVDMNVVTFSGNESDGSILDIRTNSKYEWQSNHHFANVLFHNNVMYNGSVISVANTSKKHAKYGFVNCSFVGNESYNSNGGVVKHHGTKEAQNQLTFQNCLFAYNTLGGFVKNPDGSGIKLRPQGLLSSGQYGMLSFFDCVVPGEDVFQENHGTETDRKAYGVMQYLGDEAFSTDFLAHYLNGKSTSETQRLVDAGNKAHLSTKMPLDVFGNARIQGTSVDIGAVEFSGTSSMAAATAVQEIKLYPNPTSTLAKLATEESLRSLVVYNMQGQKVLVDFANPNGSIDVSSWTNGVYLVDAETTSGKRFRGKLKVSD